MLKFAQPTIEFGNVLDAGEILPHAPLVRAADRAAYGARPTIRRGLRVVSFVGISRPVVRIIAAMQHTTTGEATRCD
jgi:hypothetical protein